MSSVYMEVTSSMMDTKETPIVQRSVDPSGMRDTEEKFASENSELTSVKSECVENEDVEPSPVPMQLHRVEQSAPSSPVTKDEPFFRCKRVEAVKRGCMVTNIELVGAASFTLHSSFVLLQSLSPSFALLPSLPLLSSI